MSYEAMKIRPLPPPKGIDEIDLVIWHEWPDRWGDCASQRSKNKYIRQRMRQNKIAENERKAAQADI